MMQENFHCNFLLLIKIHALLHRNCAKVFCYSLFWIYWLLFQETENHFPTPIYTFANLSVSNFATLSFISSSYMLFLSGKGMFFGTDQPWVKFYSSLINFSIAGLIMKLHKVIWPSLLVGTLGTAECGPCYELARGAWHFSSLLLLALLIAFTILQSSVSLDIMGFSLHFSVLHLVTGILCKSRPLHCKIISSWRKDCIVWWGTMSSTEEPLIRHPREMLLQ